MRRIWTITALVVVVGTAGVIIRCAPMLNGLAGGYTEAIENGQDEISAITEFAKLYPSANHFISYYTGQAGSPMWNSEVGLYGRYILTAKCRIEFDWTRRHIKEHGRVTFYVSEVISVQARSIRHGHSFTFGPDKWERLVDADGDLSVLDPTIKKNAPVSGFETALSN